MSTRLLDLLTCTCSIVATESIHQAMSHYVSPFVVPALDRELDLTVTVDADIAVVTDVRRSCASQPAAAVRTSHPEQRYRVWPTTGGEVLLPDQPSPDHVITTSVDHIAITAEHPRVAANIGTRVVRQLLMRGGEIREGRCVHAAAVDIDGYGILIGGHPGSGKTSVLTHLVENHGARPVANDRTVLIPADDQRWHASGVPLAWRFTPESIGGSPLLTAALCGFEPSRGRHLVDGKIELTPWEILKLLERPAVPVIPIQSIVLLARAPKPPVATGEELLRRYLDFGADDVFAEDWLGVRSQLGARHAEPDMTESLWLRLAEELPVHTLTWNDPDELPRIAAAIHRQVRS